MYNSILEKIRFSWSFQPDKPEETVEATIKALFWAAAGKPISARKAVLVTLPELDREGEKRLIILVEQRCKGVPLAYITGRQQFMGLEMMVTTAAMIPRTETEILGNETLNIAKELSLKRGNLTLLDVCSGAGNVLLGVLAHEPNSHGFGSDLSFEAVKLANMNTAHLGLQNKVEFRQGNLFEPFDNEEFYRKIDIIICNPPYISSRRVSLLNPEISKHEPNLAFDGGPFGLTILTRLVRETPKFLKPHSFLCFEVGSGQGPFVERMLNNSNQYREIKLIRDHNDQIRVFTVST